MATRLDTIQSIEIAEGVEIRLRVAGPVPRALALIIDSLIQGAIMSVAGISLGLIGYLVGNEISGGIINLVGFLVMWFYNVPFELTRKGATPGKRALGLRVVRMSGAPVNLRQSIVRNFLRFVDILPFGYGFGILSCALTPRFQRLGDLAANTVVVYEEQAEPYTFAVQPQEQADIQALAPACPLNREEQRAIVQYSDRLKDWSEARQQELADHASALTRRSGTEGVHRILGMARWIRTSS